jgi:hypothetical protein
MPNDIFTLLLFFGHFIVIVLVFKVPMIGIFPDIFIPLYVIEYTAVQNILSCTLNRFVKVSKGTFDMILDLISIRVICLKINKSVLFHIIINGNCLG